MIEFNCLLLQMRELKARKEKSLSLLRGSTERKHPNSQLSVCPTKPYAHTQSTDETDKTYFCSQQAGLQAVRPNGLKAEAGIMPSLE